MVNVYQPDELEILADETRLLVLEDDHIPVDLIRIAKAKGYVVFNIKTDEPDVSGLVDYSSKIIGVSSSDSNVRKRFTIAHEIGHVVLDHQEDGMHIDKRSPITNVKESQANYFAGAILMPRKYFTQAYRELNRDLAAVANVFDVSLDAVAVRASILGFIDDR